MNVVTRLLRACTATPLRLAATCAAITPGAHLLLSTAVERRRVTWSTDYPVVLVGDPLLAAATGIAARIAGIEAVRSSAPMRRPLLPVAVAAATAFGAWQLHDELRRGVYTRQQAFSPSKLWHQFVVYPTLTPVVAGALAAVTASASAPGAGRRERVGAALAWAGAAGWAVLCVEALHRPRLGHGSFDWSRLRGVR